jgi:hypothetical protein
MIHETKVVLSKLDEGDYVEVENYVTPGVYHRYPAQILSIRKYTVTTGELLFRVLNLQSGHICDVGQYAQSQRISRKLSEEEATVALVHLS